jgi:hypothetical protein
MKFIRTRHASRYLVAAFVAFLKAEVAKWTQLVRDTKLQIEQ